MAVIDINNGYRRISISDRGRTLLSVLQNNEIFIPSACGGQGACGYCRVHVLQGGGPVTDSERDRLKPDEIEKGIRLSCQIEVENDIAIEIPTKRFSSKRFTARLEFKRLLTPTILHLRLTLVEPKEITFIAGQYVQLESKPVGNIPSVSRAYSMASSPSEKGAVELIIRLLPGGLCTTWAFESLREGEEVTFTGPHGSFHLSETQAPVIMVAGGSGLAPLRSMLMDMKEKGIRRTGRCFFGMGTDKELFMVNEMTALAGVQSDFYFVPVVLQPGPEWKGDTGTPIEAVERRFKDLSAHEAYLCGSQGMVEACIRSFTAHGMKETSIFFDKF